VKCEIWKPPSSDVDTSMKPRHLPTPITLKSISLESSIVHAFNGCTIILGWSHASCAWGLAILMHTKLFVACALLASVQYCAQPRNWCWMSPWRHLPHSLHQYSDHLQPSSNSKPSLTPKLPGYLHNGTLTSLAGLKRNRQRTETSEIGTTSFHLLVIPRQLLHENS